MLRFGDVVEVDSDAARYRVFFPEDDLVSFPLPHVAFSVDKVKPHLPLSVGTQVACLVDGAEGVILGAVYTDKIKPTQGLTESDFVVTFDGGGRVAWDGTALKLSLDTAEVEIGPQGIRIAKAGDSMKNILGELFSAITTMTHLSAAPGAPTGPPINLVTFTTLKTRADALLN